MVEGLNSEIIKLPYNLTKIAVKESVMYDDVVPIVISESGFGKTTMMNELAKELDNHQCITINCANLQEGDLFFPYLKTESNLTEDEKTFIQQLKQKIMSVGLEKVTNKEVEKVKYISDIYSDNLTKVDFLLSPELAKIVNAYDKDGTLSVLFLDEVGYIKKDVANEIMNLMLDKEIMGKNLPTDTKIVGAMNPPNDLKGYEDTDYDATPLNNAFKSRTVAFHLDMTVEDWVNNFASKLKEGSDDTIIHESVISYLKANDNYFLSSTLGNSSSVYLNEYNKPNPRNWEHVSRAVYTHESLGKDTDIRILEAKLYGKVGFTVAQSFLEHYKNAPNYISLDDLISLYETGEKTLTQEIENKITGMEMYTLNVNTEMIIDKLTRNDKYKNYLEDVDFINLLIQVILYLGDEGFRAITDVYLNYERASENKQVDLLKNKLTEQEDYVRKYIETAKTIGK